MSNSVKTDDVIFNFFKQICDEKDDQKCVELGNNWIKAMDYHHLLIIKNFGMKVKVRNKNIHTELNGYTILEKGMEARDKQLEEQERRDNMSDEENKVLLFPGTAKPESNDELTHEAIDPKEMLKAISEEIGMSEVIVLGWTDDEELFMATSHPSSPEIVWLLELSKSMFVNKSINYLFTRSNGLSEELEV